jgi:hypothetical protein
MVVHSKKPKKSRIISSADVSTRQFLFTQSFQNRIQRIPVSTQGPTAGHLGQDSPQVESNNDPSLVDPADEQSPGGVKIYQKAKRYLNSVSINHICLVHIYHTLLSRIAHYSPGATNIGNSILMKFWLWRVEAVFGAVGCVLCAAFTRHLFVAEIVAFQLHSAVSALYVHINSIHYTYLR